MKKWLLGGAALALVATGVVAPTFASETQSYAYDPLGRLARVKYSGTINNGQAHSLCYDPAGNRTRYRSSSTGVLATCTGAGATGSSFEPTELAEAPPEFELPPDVYPPSDETAGEAPLPDAPPEEAAGPAGDGTELPPDPPPPPDLPPVEDPGDPPTGPGE